METLLSVHENEDASRILRAAFLAVTAATLSPPSDTSERAREDAVALMNWALSAVRALPVLPAL